MGQVFVFLVSLPFAVDLKISVPVVTLALGQGQCSEPHACDLVGVAHAKKPSTSSSVTTWQ
jgi:hypothetical protein